SAAGPRACNRWSRASAPASGSPRRRPTRASGGSRAACWYSISTLSRSNRPPDRDSDVEGPLMDLNRRRILATVAASVMTTLSVSSPMAQTPFHLEEATIVRVRAAFASGQLTCTQLTRLYLNRIEAYNLKGPSLHAIITVNPHAMETAAEMDRQRSANATG